MDPLIFVIALLLFLLFIVLTIKDKLFPQEENNKTEEENAKEIVDSIIRTETIEEQDEEE